MAKGKTVKEALREVEKAAENVAKETKRVRANGRRVVVRFGRSTRRRK